MLSKIDLTSKFLSEAGLEIDDIVIKKYLRLLWKDARPKSRSLELTKFGFDFLNEQSKLKFYQLVFLKKPVYTNDLVISLNKFIDCPFYIEQDRIFVSREKVAVQLILLESNLEQFVKTKKYSLTI